jgi:conjugative relaxase-like TrwC/TraI family protein
MMGVRRLASNRVDYYLSDLALELPWPAARQAIWVGQAAEGLGLRGPVGPPEFRAVLNGRHPGSGSPLRSGRATVAGFDLTFTAPKSVSVLFGLGGPEVAQQVLAAHGEAVADALGYVARHAMAARRGSGEGRTVVPVRGLIGGAFTHGVSRNGDPHLHTHVVVANLVQGLDGRWSACDQRGLTAHRSAASASYDAHLRASLSRRIGVDWHIDARGRSEVRGVSPLLLGEFSSRSADIHRRMAQWGTRSAHGAHVSWAVTRPEKQTSPGFDALVGQWAARALAVEGRPFDMAPLLSRSGRPSQSPVFDEHRVLGLLSLAPDGAARRRDVMAALATAATRGARVDSLEQITDAWTPREGGVPAVGVAEAAWPLRRVVPSPHLLRALGPRPVDVEAHQIWRDAAQAIEHYRADWGVTAGADPLVIAPPKGGLSQLSTSQLIDHTRMSRHVVTARQRLGWRAPLSMEIDRGR